MGLRSLGTIYSVLECHRTRATRLSCCSYEARHSRDHSFKFITKCQIHNGRYWSAAVTDLGLGFVHITPLEFVAYDTEVILAGDGAGDGARVVIYTDSLSSTDVICREPPSALLMRVIHSEIAALPEFRALAPVLVTGHCFGEGNSAPTSLRAIASPNSSRSARRSASRRGTSF